MEHDVFAAWLEGIDRLTAEQRGQVFRALALAEAADDGNSASVARGLGPAFLVSPVGGPPDGHSGGTVGLIGNPAEKAAPRRPTISRCFIGGSGSKQGGSHGMPSLRRPEAPAMGTTQWSATLPL